MRPGTRRYRLPRASIHTVFQTKRLITPRLDIIQPEQMRAFLLSDLARLLGIRMLPVVVDDQLPIHARHPAIIHRKIEGI